MKTVYVVEDQTILRDLICRLLESNPNITLVGSTGDGQEAVRFCEEKTPDVVVLDIMLPALNGVEILRRLKNRKPETRFLVFSAHPSRSLVRQSLEAGVDGFIEKNAGLEELEEAIGKVCAGQTYFGPHIVEIMREIMVHPDLNDAFEDLTAREREMLQLIAESYTSKEIAQKLDISVKTADTHRANLMRKLDVHDVAGLTRNAIAFGLVEPPRKV